MMKRRAVGGALGAALCAGFWTKAHPKSEAPSRIVVGQSAAMSGPASELGRQYRLGADLHFAQVNAQGGVNGRTIDFVSLDDGYDPDRCVRNTRELIERGAVALLGYVGTAPSLAALPMVTAEERLFFAPFTGSEAIRIPFNPYAFHVRASYVDETNAIVKHLTSVGTQRIGVFYQNDGDGKAGLLGVARALKRQYQSSVGLGFVERNSSDVSAAVKSILAGRPDAIVQISTYQSCAAFIREARAAGFAGVFYNISLVGAQALARELGPDARGVVVSQVMPFPFSAKSRLSGEYLAVGRQAMGPAFEPSYISMEGYVAAKTFVEGLRRAGPDVSPRGIMTALESMRELEMGGFRVGFEKGRRAGSRFVDLTILSEDGKTRY
jgi:ABC-type branched-subunit amino acid transport system substrate-binding protein